MSIYYKISAPAKLNLNLFIKHKMFEQLHFLESKMCFLELSDQIYFKFSNHDSFYQKNNSFTINPRDNLILNAVINLDYLQIGTKILISSLINKFLLAQVLVEAQLMQQLL